MHASGLMVTRLRINLALVEDYKGTGQWSAANESSILLLFGSICHCLLMINLYNLRDRKRMKNIWQLFCKLLGRLSYKQNWRNASLWLISFLISGTCNFQGMSIDPSKVRVIINWTRPTRVIEIGSSMCLAEICWGLPSHCCNPNLTEAKGHEVWEHREL